MKTCDDFKNMSEENISQEFRLRNVNKTKYYFLKEIQQNKLMSEKHKKVCTTLNDIDNFILADEPFGIIDNNI